MALQPGRVTSRDSQQASRVLSWYVSLAGPIVLYDHATNLLTLEIDFCRAYHAKFGGHLAQLKLQMNKGDWEVWGGLMGFYSCIC